MSYAIVSLAFDTKQRHSKKVSCWNFIDNNINNGVTIAAKKLCASIRIHTKTSQ